MKQLRWQILIVVVTLALVGVLLLTREPGEQVFAPQPTTGGIYTEGLVGSLSRLNPLLDFNNPADRDIDRLLFSGLIRFDSRGMPMPDLAESWGVSEDGKIYNFTLRGNAYWHDGQPVTSDDVLFTLDLIKANASLYSADVSAMWKEIKITRRDDKNIRFDLPEPFAPFLDYLTFGVLPKHILETVPASELVNAPFNLAPIGTGPYRFDHLIVENGQALGVALVPFEKYYGSAPFIEQMIFRYYPSSRAALDAYRQGEVLAISRITPDVLPEALAYPGLAVHTGRLPELSMVLFNLNDPAATFLQDAKLRRALLLGLNRQYMVDRLLGGQAIVADGPIFPGTWAYYEGVEHLDYDPDAAIALLKANNYAIPATGGDVRADKDGKLIEFTLAHPDDALHTSLAQSIQRDWAKIGVKANLQAVPYDQLVNDLLIPRQYQAALIDLNLSRMVDPDPYPFWHQSEATGGQNYSQWNNHTASEYLEQARTTTKYDERTRLYRNFQAIFAKELPALPLYYPVYSFGVDRQVFGVQLPALFDTSDRFQTITQWYLITRRTIEGTLAPNP
jgi:peptide/nickel transport system substrate-binding protein